MSLIVTITGPSGSGKTTLEAALSSELFSKVISTTTRDKRVGEVEGVDYYFVTKEEFETADAAGEFIESVDFKSNGYAVSGAEIDRVFATGKAAVIVCEPEGKAQIKKYADAVSELSVKSVYVTNDLEVLVQRVLDRETSELFDSEYLAKRLVNLTTVERYWMRMSSWDIVFNWFNESNAGDVIGYIENLAIERLPEKVKSEAA